MKNKLRQVILLLGDIFFAYFSLVLTVFLRFGRNFNWKIFSLHLLPFSVIYLGWFLIFYILDLYELNLTHSKFLFYPRVFGALLSGGILATIFFYLIPIFGITPKTNLLLNIFIFGILIFGWRKIFYYLFSYRFLINLGILGINKEAINLIKEILIRPYLGYNIKTVYKINQKGSFSFLKIKTQKIKKNFSAQIQKDKIDILIITENLRSNSKITKILYQCLSTKIGFLDLSKAYEIVCGKIPISFVNQIWFLENLREGEKIFYDKIKRIFDLIFAFLFLILTIPLWGLIALAIKLEDGGSIFYRQKRIGKEKKVFKLIKFRSMIEKAEKETGPVFAKKEDKRITTVGKFLRRTHLDELPQMINILKGEISLIGPRPERPEFVKILEKKIPYYHLRHLIKPGFTGWAQIKFKYTRTIVDSFEKFQYDLYYLKNRNLFLDFGILLKTFQLFFKKE